MIKFCISQHAFLGIFSLALTSELSPLVFSPGHPNFLPVHYHCQIPKTYHKMLLISFESKLILSTLFYIETQYIYTSIPNNTYIYNFYSHKLRLTHRMYSVNMLTTHMWRNITNSVCSTYIVCFYSLSM